MFFKGKKRLCEICQTGKELYEVDQHSEFCFYVDCYKEKKCPFFVSIKTVNYRNKKKNILKKVLEKLIQGFSK